VAELNAPALPIREVALIVLFTLSVYVFLAIVSYSPMDPAWTFSGADLTVSNLVGKSGAWIADILLFMFGWIAYVLPLALFIAGLRLLGPIRIAWTWSWFGIRCFGWAGVMVATCVLARLHITNADTLPAGSGGIAGDWLTTLGLPVFNLIGLTLLSMALFLVGIQLALGYSWIRVAEITGKGVHRVISRLVAGIDMIAVSARDLVRGIKTRLSGTGRKNRTIKIVQRKSKRAAPTLKSRPSQKSKSTTTQEQMQLDMKTSLDMPDLDLLDEDAGKVNRGYSNEKLDAMSRLLELKLADFGIEAEVGSVLPGPVVTRFEVQPAPGVKVSRITALAKDLARSLAVISVRIVEVIPGKAVVGIEIPNEQREVVRLKDILSSTAYSDSSSPLTLALGKDIAGEPVMTDVAKMPHLLIAGTTGSGKSVGVNAMLLSMLYKATPDELRLILVDPKMLELSVYEGIPHLLTPVVTDMREAAYALNWCLAEMERRYRLMAALGVRNLEDFNRRISEAAKLRKPISDPLWPEDNEDSAPLLTPLPLIVVVIDEFADMMMIVGKKVEQLIARIAQKARAAGIHLILATQRPSVDVITGLIKANIPTRMSFQVSSKVDSRTILDQGGAEQLLGHGDMLFLPPGAGIPVRVHGAFISDEEVHNVVSDWKRRAEPNYQMEVLEGGDENATFAIPDIRESTEQSDNLYDEAVAYVLESRRASISSVQRKLRIGYNRAARMIEAMEEAGVVSAMNSNGSREVLVPSRN
jgi:S-DNA-T family DNA segregation ATPase FtsK/SpoIIIE